MVSDLFLIHRGVCGPFDLNESVPYPRQIMVGVGKLLKQAQKMQQKMEEAQAELSNEIIDVSGGGGAVSIKITGQGEFKELKLDPEFLKEDSDFVAEAILQAVVDASEQAKKKNDEVMSGLTGGMQMPGLF